MSYDLSLTDPESGNVIELDFEHNHQGGTFAVGGTQQAWLNVTYNYGKIYRRVFHGDDGLNIIEGLTGEQSKSFLDAAIAQLGDDESDNYWDATEGNAKASLMDLRVLAMLAPQGVWEIT